MHSQTKKLHFALLKYLTFKPVLALCRTATLIWHLRGVLFIVRAGNDIIKADFMHTKRTNFLTKMKIGIHLEELK